MADRLPDMLLSQLSDFVAERIGFHFPRERWPDPEPDRSIGQPPYCRRDLFFPRAAEFSDSRGACLTRVDSKASRHRQAPENLERRLLHGRGTVLHRHPAQAKPSRLKGLAD